MNTKAAPVAEPRTLGLAGGLMPRIERLLARASRVGDRPWFGASTFPWVRCVERWYPAMRGEVEALLRSGEAVPGFEEISQDQQKLSSDRRWKTFFLLGYGVRFDENIERCPATWAAVRHIPGLTTAFFSILEPGKQLPRHRGPYKGVLRYHLGLVVPRDGRKCAIEVAGEARHWRAGHSLIFDDSYLHSAWNLSDEVRVVLFVDFARPLVFPFNLLNRLFLRVIARSGYVQEARANYRKWQAAAHRP